MEADQVGNILSNKKMTVASYATIQFAVRVRGCVGSKELPKLRLLRGTVLTPLLHGFCHPGLGRRSSLGSGSTGWDVW